MGQNPDTGPMMIGNTPAGAAKPKIECWWDKDFGQPSIVFEGEDVPYVGDFWNDQFSAVKVYSGTWRLYQNISFNGGPPNEGRPGIDYVDAGPGTYRYIGDIQNGGDHFNDAVTSLRPISFQ